MEYNQIQKNVIGIFETILKDKGQKSKINLDKELRNQDFDSLETMDAFWHIEELLEEKYGLHIDLDKIDIPINPRGDVGLTPKHIVDYVADQFPMEKRAD